MMPYDDPYAPRPLSGLARGSHQLPGPAKKPTGTGRFTKDGQEIVLSYQTLHNAEKFVAENPNDNFEVKPHGTTDDGDKVYYVVKKMNETFEIAWELMKSDGRSFRLNFGPKNLYLVIEYDDGKELFMQDYDSFLEEFRQAEAMVDEDYLEMMYGVGSEYHGIAQHPEDMGKSDEKGDNAPTNPGLWAQAKSKARSKFKVYPSAYANGWAAKWYKSKGGGWKKKSKGGKKK